MNRRPKPSVIVKLTQVSHVKKLMHYRRGLPVYIKQKAAEATSCSTPSLSLFGYKTLHMTNNAYGAIYFNNPIYFLPHPA